MSDTDGVNGSKVAGAAGADVPGGDDRADAPDEIEGGRSGGGRSTHLPPEARALIVRLIVEGRPNVEINEELRKAKHLGRGESLSRRALTRYRQSEEVRMKVRHLTEEAVQVGAVALSEALVLTARAMRAAGAELLTEDGRMRPNTKAGNTPRLRLAAGTLFKGAQFLWDNLGGSDAMEALRKSEDRATDEIRRSDLPEEVKAELILRVREAHNAALRQLVERKRQKADDARKQAAAASGEGLIVVNGGRAGASEGAAGQ